MGTEIPPIYHGFPAVPSVPAKNVGGYNSTETRSPAPGPAELRPLFVSWFDTRIHLDSETVALRKPQRWYTGLLFLYADFVAWLFARDVAPCTRGQFRALLFEFSFTIIDIHGEPMVPDVGICEDVSAMQSPQIHPQREPSTPWMESRSFSKCLMPLSFLVIDWQRGRTSGDSTEMKETTHPSLPKCRTV